MSISNDLDQFRDEVNSKLSAITKEQESLRRQFIALSSTSENRDDKVRAILGKMDELDHQLQTYWKDTKAELATLKAENIRAQAPAKPQTPPKQDDTKHETAYKEAFDAFQKGSYDEAVDRFSSFISAHPGDPLVSNAYYWLGESYMDLKNYEKAIVNFQEVVDKYPTSDKASRALLSQAEAFTRAKDEKSSITILKKVIELYPKTEEATIAERKLRNLGFR
jgi:tol-pal system protein YbgF